MLVLVGPSAHVVVAALLLVADAVGAVEGGRDAAPGEQFEGHGGVVSAAFAVSGVVLAVLRGGVSALLNVRAPLNH